MYELIQDNPNVSLIALVDNKIILTIKMNEEKVVMIEAGDCFTKDVISELSSEIGRIFLLPVSKSGCDKNMILFHVDCHTTMSEVLDYILLRLSPCHPPKIDCEPQLAFN